MSRRKTKRKVKPKPKAVSPNAEFFRGQIEQISKHLSRVESGGYRGHVIFADWLDLVEASLKQWPVHLRHLQETGQLAPHDPPEIEALFKQLHQKYPRQSDWQAFSAALGTLLWAVSQGYYDVLGGVYLAFAYPNLRAGQFFTPWDVAYLMAGLTLGDGPAEIEKRLEQALQKALDLDETGQLQAQVSAIKTSLYLAQLPPDQHWLTTEFGQTLWAEVLPHYQPLSIADICVGSGVMLCAAASQFPAYAVQLGLVQFHGMDIDPLCVQMARLNCQLYGLNGSQLKAVLEAEAAELTRLPEPVGQVYRRYQVAHQNGDQSGLAQVQAEVAQYRQTVAVAR